MQVYVHIVYEAISSDRSSSIENWCRISQSVDKASGDPLIEGIAIMGRGLGAWPAGGNSYEHPRQG